MWPQSLIGIISPIKRHLVFNASCDPKGQGSRKKEHRMCSPSRQLNVATPYKCLQALWPILYLNMFASIAKLFLFINKKSDGRLMERMGSTATALFTYPVVGSQNINMKNEHWCNSGSTAASSGARRSSQNFTARKIDGKQWFITHEGVIYVSLQLEMPW